ncbi:isoprenylcysteine carboxyl methyltransferase [Actinomadura verrucosospora]|uniref:Isoprenylcysteine carboxyl methyltransferase n=1 Tax=Actinomadura verrucosospora TaxID=46165 RepID=A0A7D3W5U9_ACTVE|nr:isoprenylcysteine carboxyl methyltransferase [Actinomadura verrucosospora]
MPRAAFAAGAGVLTAGIAVHAARGGAAPAAMLALYLGWLLLEAPVTFRRAAASPADARTLPPYALARLLLVASAALGPFPWAGSSAWSAIPALLFVAGVALRWTAIRTLGRFYSHHVMRQDGHRVVTGGVYRAVRHPAYAGMLLANLAFTCFFLTPLSAAAFVLLVAAVAWRIRVEERAMWDVPGYPPYAAGRARVLPKVW